MPTPIRKWIFPILLGGLIIVEAVFVLFYQAHLSLTSWSLLLPTLSGVAFFGLGWGIYQILYPRAGLRSLLFFHFLAAIVIISYQPASGNFLLSLWTSLCLAFIPPFLFQGLLLISEMVIKIKKWRVVFFLIYLISATLFLTQYFWYQSRTLERFVLNPTIWIYFGLVYLFWFFRLLNAWINPPLLMARFWAKCLLLGQLTLFIIPLLGIFLYWHWKGPLAFYLLSPVILFFPVSLLAGIYPGIGQQMEVYLVQSEKRKSFGDLLAGLTHEINNPLNFIYSNMEPLQEGIKKIGSRIPKTDQEGQKILGDLRSMATSMEAGVETIHELIQTFRGFPKPRPEQKEEVDINQILNQCIELLAHKWKNKITIERDFGEIKQIRGFPMELQQAFTNLIANACDATPEGGVVGIMTQPVAGGVNVFFRDTGTGIKKDDIGKIFDPFFTTKGQGKGTGLGLSIAQQIIKSHKGSIEVQSEVGVGTEILVFLPV